MREKVLVTVITDNTNYGSYNTYDALGLRVGSQHIHLYKNHHHIRQRHTTERQ